VMGLRQQFVKSLLHKYVRNLKDRHIHVDVGKGTIHIDDAVLEVAPLAELLEGAGILLAGFELTGARATDLRIDVPWKQVRTRRMSVNLGRIELTLVQHPTTDCGRSDHPCAYWSAVEQRQCAEWAYAFSVAKKPMSDKRGMLDIMYSGMQFSIDVVNVEVVCCREHSSIMTIQLHELSYGPVDASTVQGVTFSASELLACEKKVIRIGVMTMNLASDEGLRKVLNPTPFLCLITYRMPSDGRVVAPFSLMTRVEVNLETIYVELDEDQAKIFLTLVSDTLEAMALLTQRLGNRPWSDEQHEAFLNGVRERHTARKTTMSRVVGSAVPSASFLKFSRNRSDSVPASNIETDCDTSETAPTPSESEPTPVELSGSATSNKLSFCLSENQPESPSLAPLSQSVACLDDEGPVGSEREDRELDFDNRSETASLVSIGSNTTRRLGKLVRGNMPTAKVPRHYLSKITSSSSRIFASGGKTSKPDKTVLTEEALLSPRYDEHDTNQYLDFDTSSCTSLSLEDLASFDNESTSGESALGGYLTPENETEDIPASFSLVLPVKMETVHPGTTSELDVKVRLRCLLVGIQRSEERRADVTIDDLFYRMSCTTWLTDVQQRAVVGFGGDFSHATSAPAEERGSQSDTGIAHYENRLSIRSSRMEMCSESEDDGRPRTILRPLDDQSGVLTVAWQGGGPPQEREGLLFYPLEVLVQNVWALYSPPDLEWLSALLAPLSSSDEAESDDSSEQKAKTVHLKNVIVQQTRLDKGKSLPYRVRVDSVTLEDVSPDFAELGAYFGLSMKGVGSECIFPNGSEDVVHLPDVGDMSLEQLRSELTQRRANYPRGKEKAQLSKWASITKDWQTNNLGHSPPDTPDDIANRR